MQEIANDIFAWSWFSEPHGYDFNGHLIRHSEGNLCIDPVKPSAEDLEAIVRFEVGQIILTNRNHSRAANLLRLRTGAKTAIHPDDAHHARSQGAEIDEALRIGEQIGPLDVIGVPGKSPGEVAFYWRARRVLIVGDAVIGSPPGRCGLLQEQVMDDAVGLRRSVRKLLDLDFDTLLVGDGVSIPQGAKDRLRELADSFSD
ncbi:MAG: MBL fold metallo-hydrolase [Gammaproteobacteria bacterium]